jgi:hypothetical protein
MKGLDLAKSTMETGRGLVPKDIIEFNIFDYFPGVTNFIKKVNILEEVRFFSAIQAVFY